MDDSALEGLLADAAAVLPVAERVEALALLAARGGSALPVDGAFARALGEVRLDPRLHLAALSALSREFSVVPPDLRLFRRTWEAGLLERLLPEGFSEIVLHEGAEFLAPLIPLLEPASPGSLRCPSGAVVHLFAPALPSPRGTVTVGEGELRSSDDASRLAFTPDGERQLLEVLESVPRGLPDGHLAVVIVPSWALWEAVGLAAVREAWTTSGVLRRAADLLDGQGQPAAISLIVLGGPREYPPSTFDDAGLEQVPANAYPKHLQPVLLPRIGRPDEPDLKWYETPLFPGYSNWRLLWGNDPGPDGHALHFLRTLVSGGLPVAEAAKRLGKDVDADYFERLLSQPPYLRALARGNWDKVSLPLPDLPQQREIAAKLLDHTADLYEIACLLQNVDPRDGARSSPPGSPSRLSSEVQRLHKSLASHAPGWFGRLLNFMSSIVGQAETPDPAAGWLSQFYERMNGAILAASDSEQTRDLGLRIALLSNAIAKISGDGSKGRLDALLVSTLRETLVRQRGKAVGPAGLACSVVRAVIEDETTEVLIGVVNEGQTTLFDLRFIAVRLGAKSAAPAQELRVLESGARARLHLTFESASLGEDRVDIRWEARNVLGEKVKGRVVLPVTVFTGGTDVDVGPLWVSHRWDDLARVAQRQDVPRSSTLFARAVLALRAGDEALVRALFTDLASAMDADDVPGTLLVLACLGRDRLALEIAEDAWLRSDGDGTLALALGRLRAWSGRTDAALSVLHRAAADFEPEALAVSAALLARANRKKEANDQLRGIERDDSMRLALLPFQLLSGDRAEAERLAAEAKDLEVDDNDVVWTVMDLFHFGYDDLAGRLATSWNWQEPRAKALVLALLYDRQGDSVATGQQVALVFGADHRYAPADGGPVVELPGNPYIIGKPVEDVGRFFGRDEEIVRILRTVAAPESTGVVLLEGARRVGKTSILHQVRARMPDGTLVVPLNLQELGTDPSDAGVWSALSMALRRALRLTPTQRRATPGAPTYSAFSEEVEEVLAGGQWRAVTLLVDEFEVLDGAVEAGTVSAGLVGQLRHLAQTQPVSMVIAGAHELARSRREYRSPLFGFAVVVRVASLAVEDARDLLSRPTRGLFEWTDEALSHALELTDAQPFFLQHLGWQVYEGRRARPRVSPVSVEELHRVVPATVQAAEEHLDGLYAALPDALARSLVGRLAAEPVLDPAGFSRDDLVSLVAGDQSLELVKGALDDLDDRRITAPGSLPGRVRLAVRLFHHRVAERHPWLVEDAT